MNRNLGLGATALAVVGLDSGCSGAPGKDDGHQQQQHQPCAFAAAHVMASPGGHVFAAPLLQAAALDTQTPRTAIHVAAAFTPQSPRAPPRSA